MRAFTAAGSLPGTLQHTLQEHNAVCCTVCFLCCWVLPLLHFHQTHSLEEIENIYNLKQASSGATWSCRGFFLGKEMFSPSEENFAFPSTARSLGGSGCTRDLSQPTALPVTKEICGDLLPLQSHRRPCSSSVCCKII